MTKLLLAESHAEGAQALPAFHDVNLLGIRQKASEILGLIGVGPCFKNYTRHDISHIDKLLGMLEWIVPEGTKACMTSSDWLLVTLGIYFHDIGMLVTQDEFNDRDRSGFRQYCDEHLFVGREGSDYKARVDQLGEEAEPFLYEEFVRAHHGKRAAEWIRGRPAAHLGYSPQATKEVSAALSTLPQAFRDDLAKVCESHHLSDLWDTAKYRLDQPYGDSDEETANVQYAAALLRTVDLLHVTADRAPSVTFRLLNPQDPISQREWAKQGAVRRVRAQKGRDKDGAFSETADRDTVEVVAEFEDAEGFFGLTSYLSYADKELRQTREWVEAAAAHFDLDYHFPWRRVDDSQVTAKGFSPNRLTFTLDQGKILDLLTGHTLYNDTSVVVRELVQNALDAVRLQALILGVESTALGIDVTWNSADRELTVRDQGTGMTQSVIENNLLKAGSSRYQEDNFKKKFSSFSPISRFGIGVLSAFMIANEVEIVTSSPDEEEARLLTLRSVHGRYLVQLLDKATDARARALGAHGTEIRLKLRESAVLPDVLETLKKWIVIPRVKVEAVVDGNDPVSIGFASPADAVTSMLAASGVSVYVSGRPQNDMAKVVEYELDGVSTAFVTEWQQYFQEWGFLDLQRRRLEDVASAVGTCVEGVRVEAATAGFDGMNVVALSNAVGHSAPKTNVARSGLEATPERTRMLRAVYNAYLQHVALEARALVEERGQSLTWAAQEAEVLLEPLLETDDQRDSDVKPLQTEVFNSAVRAHPVVLVERDGQRTLAAADSLDEDGHIWTVDSAYVRAAERLLREVPGARSLTSVSEALDSSAFALPGGASLIGYESGSALYETALQGREVGALVINRSERRVDLRWDKAGEGKWLTLVANQTRDQSYYARRTLRGIYVSSPGRVEVEGRRGETAVRAHELTFLFDDTPLGAFLAAWLGEGRPPGVVIRRLVGRVVSSYLGRAVEPEDFQRFMAQAFLADTTSPFTDMKQVEELVDVDELEAALEETSRDVFDTSAWRRGYAGW